jgi:UPF0755 protein
MKKILWAITIIILLSAGFVAWKIFGSNVHIPERKYFYIPTGSDYESVKNALIENKIINSATWFNLVSKQLKYKIVKPGKYEIKKGMSVFNLVRMLKNGQQSPVQFVIVKFRTREDFAKRIGKEFETDSLQMINFFKNNDSLKTFGLDTNTWTCSIIPDTYTFFWNTTPRKIFDKLHSASQKFWTNDRLEKIKEKNLTPIETYTLASIVEEETLMKNDKGNIASVYLNRIAKGIKLQADPTVKFAMKNFGLKRIYDKNLSFPSPYNTYINKGLPPGPICTPSVETLDEVINAPKTDYFYFVANSDLNGSSIFSSSYEDHIKYARLYQHALDVQDSIKKANQPEKK